MKCQWAGVVAHRGEDTRKGRRVRTHAAMAAVHHAPVLETNACDEQANTAGTLPHSMPHKKNAMKTTVVTHNPHHHAVTPAAYQNVPWHIVPMVVIGQPEHQAITAKLQEEVCETNSLNVFKEVCEWHA